MFVMADIDSAALSDNEKNTRKGATKKGAKRTQSATTKKAPVTKKLKTSAVKGKSKTESKAKTKTKSAKYRDGSSGLEVGDIEGEQSSNGVKSDDVQSTTDTSPSKMSIEEKRKAIKAERLRKQQEMDALMEQEEALLKAAEAEEDELICTEETAPKNHGIARELTNQSADSSYDTRSEIEGSHDEERGKQDSKDEFESMDDTPVEDPEAEQSSEEMKSVDQSLPEDVHEPPLEAGLAGLDDDEEDEFADEPAEEHERKRPISPVTWDVDVHIRDDNISDDSPLASDDESIADDGAADEDDDHDSEKKADASQKQEPDVKKLVKIPISNHVKTDSGLHNASPDSSPERAASPEGGKDQAVDAAEALRPRIHKYLYREAKYFMVKSNNHENVRLAKAKGVWSTPPQNEIRFNKAVEDNTTVILVFSVKESGAFQGFARINGNSQKDGPKINWVLPPGISAKALSGVFKLDWISRTDLSFTRTAHLRNPWNQNKPVKIARDGQEIEPHTGESLSKLFILDGSSDYERVISRVKRKREALQAKGPPPINRPPYRPAPSSTRQGHGDYRSESRGYNLSNRGAYRGGGPGGGYRPGPPPPSYSSSRHPSGGMNPPPHHGYNSQPPNQYFTSSSNRSSYGGDYRSRSNYPPARPSYQPQPPPYHSAAPVSPDIFVKGSYEQYVDQMRRAGNGVPDMGNPMAMYDAYSASYHAGGRDAPPPPPIPSYSTSRERERDRGRPSADRYNRAVEDFLRRTSSNNSSSRSSRGGNRYKDPRDPRDSKDPRESRDPRDGRDSRDPRDPRDYHRGRSRSRERERHRERR